MVLEDTFPGEINSDWNTISDTWELQFYIHKINIFGFGNHHFSLRKTCSSAERPMFYGHISNWVVETGQFITSLSSTPSSNTYIKQCWCLWWRTHGNTHIVTRWAEDHDLSKFKFQNYLPCPLQKVHYWFFTNLLQKCVDTKLVKMCVDTKLVKMFSYKTMTLQSHIFHEVKK